MGRNKLTLELDEEDLEVFAEDLADADTKAERVRAVAELIAAGTPNGPVPSFLSPLVDKVEADLYVEAYGAASAAFQAAKKWATRVFTRESPKQRKRKRKGRGTFKARRAKRKNA